MRVRRTVTGAVIAGAVALGVGVPGFNPTAGAAPGADPIVALTTGNRLLSFTANAPAAAGGPIAIGGLQAGELIVGVDIRPATGELIGVGVVAGNGRVYRIDRATGMATAIGATPFSTTLPSGGTWVVDVNPTVDRIRVVHSSGLNLRVNPLNGALAATDTAISGGQATAGSYDRSLATATVTTLFGIDAVAAQLVTVGGIDSTPSPNGGVLAARGPLGVTPTGPVGFDISPTGSALASIQTGGTTNLYELSLTTGAATLVGAIGSGTTPITDLAFVPTLPTGAAAFTAVAPTRLLDTREGGVAKPAAGATIDLQVTGIAGVPANATAVVLNTTGTEATAAGFVTVYPAGEARVEVSNHNLVAGQTRANLVTVKVGTGGKVSVYTQNGTHLVVDVFGYYAPATGTAGRFTPLTPGRLLDTRLAGTKIAPGTAVNIQVAGAQGVPATGVAAVVVNLTPTETDGLDVITAYAAGQPKPSTSNVNTDQIGGTDSNLAIVPLGANGMITVHSLRGTHLVVDVVGWFGDPTSKGGYGGLFVPVSPNRILDTRSGVGAPKAQLPINGSLSLTVAGAGGVPSTGASAALLNVTDVDTLRTGFVNVSPTGAPLIDVSSINVDRAGRTVANLVSARLGTSGAVTMFSYTGGDLLADVAGWYTA